MNWLFTGCALVLLIGCALCVVLAFRARNECDDVETNLRRSLGRIAGLEAEVDVLSKQIHKLRGKLYGDARATEEKLQIEIANAPLCDNYVAAQREGPGSQAARCECDFCNAKRTERDALRAKLVPKTNSERRDAIEKARRN